MNSKKHFTVAERHAYQLLGCAYDILHHPSPPQTPHQYYLAWLRAHCDSKHPTTDEYRKLLERCQHTHATIMHRHWDTGYTHSRYEAALRNSLFITYSEWLNKFIGPMFQDFAQSCLRNPSEWATARIWLESGKVLILSDVHDGCRMFITNHETFHMSMFSNISKDHNLDRAQMESVWHGKKVRRQWINTNMEKV